MSRSTGVDSRQQTVSIGDLVIIGNNELYGNERLAEVLGVSDRNVLHVRYLKVLVLYDGENHVEGGSTVRVEC